MPIMMMPSAFFPANLATERNSTSTDDQRLANYLADDGKVVDNQDLDFFTHEYSGYKR